MRVTYRLFALPVLLAGITLSFIGCQDGNPNQAPSSVAQATPAPSSLPAPASGSATLSWEAPTENTNGTALTDLSGFRIYYGQDTAHLVTYVTLPNLGVLIYVIDGLPVGATYYFAVTALASDGEESAPSVVATKTIT